MTHYQKSIVVTLMLALIGVGTVKGTSAYPGIIDYRQPDGAIIRLRMMGDEYFHWAESEDGFTLLSDAEGFMTLAMPDKEGRLMASEYRMQPAGMREEKLRNAMKEVGRNATFPQKQLKEEVKRAQARRNLQMDMVRNNQPVVGIRHFLVILMQTPDVPFQRSQTEFQRLMNEVNYHEGGNTGSVHDFYAENSFGQLDLQCDVTPIYTAAHPMAYYGNNNDGNPYALAAEALAAAASSYNMANYDADGDGYLDGVHIIFSGHGEEAGGGDNCIWSHQATTSGSFGSAGGKKMNAYSCSPELRGAFGNDMTYIGVICHEIGHALGTMDFYDTNYSTGGQYPGTGQWDLMASGNWNDNGATPAHFNPYSKIYDFGWSDVQDGNVASMKTLHAKTKGDFVRIDTHTEGEYFLLECRAKTGFDASLPGQGLMVYRASDDLSRLPSNTVNASHRQQFYPLCANAKEAIPTSAPNTYGSVNDPSAPFPGTLRRTQLTDATIPSMKDWEGHNTSLPITDIAYTAGSVSLCLAGGDGLAYNLRCESLQPTSLVIDWKNDAKASVLLAYNTEDVFDTPGSTDWQSGQTMSSGGSILYEGNGTSYTLTNIEAGTYYYFRLYTRANDGSWKGERTLTVKTPTSIVTRFPYTEDFSTGTLDAGWSQEYVYGTNDWVVDKRFNTSEYSLNFEWSFDMGQHQGTRAILPVFDFSGHTVATLDFDYRNMLIRMDVVYRTSPDAEWKLLCTLDNHYSGTMTLQEAIDAETHASILLPNISSTYQVAFVSDFTWRGNGKSNLEIGTIDNIEVKVDFDAIVMLQNLATVSNTWADVVVNCADGKVSLTEQGVEWSKDGSTWNRVASPSKGVSTVHITYLPANTTIYYRAYGIKPNDSVIYSEPQSFKTLSFGRGSGTEADPFILSSQSDWNQLAATANTRGLYFALGCSFAYTPVNMPLFEGCLDGRGYTLSTDTNSRGIPLFNQTGSESVIKNLKLSCSTYQNQAWSGAMVTFHYGRIENCDVSVSNLKLVSNEKFGGFVLKNYGVISDSHAYVHMPLSNIHNYGQSGSFANSASVGGLCWYNFNIIDHCSFDGDLHSNNNSRLGGITALNYYESDQQKGIITNCINRGTLEIAKVNNNAWAISVGGIAGSNYGDIRYCVNEGAIIVAASSSDAKGGGIIGDSDYQTKLTCCLNRGSIQYSTTDDGAGTGGIIGFSDRSETAYCISTGTVSISGSLSSSVHPIAGSHRDDVIHDCYYTGSVNDDYGIRATDWDAAVADLNIKAGVPFLTVVSGQPVMLWETGEEIPFLELHAITEFTATTIGGLFTSSANLKSCGLLFKESDADVWNRLEYPSEEMRHPFLLEGLTPLTQYQIKAFVIDWKGHTYYTDVTTIMTDFTSSGRMDDPYLISSVKDFRNFAILTQQGKNMENCLVRLTEDLDMKASEGEVWTDFVEGFSGEFDGGGHYIYNLKSVSSEDHFGEGLFTDGSGYIHDLHVFDAEMICTRPNNSVFYVGTIAGICNRIERCSYIGKMTFKYESDSWSSWCSGGGIVGCANLFARDCYALVELSSNWNGHYGGVLGRGTVYSSYTACLSTQTPKTMFVGMAGNDYANATADSCYYLPAVMKSGALNGTAMTLGEMKDGTLLAALSDGVWAADIHGTLLDGGFPVLKSQQPLPGTAEKPDDPNGPDTDLTAYPNVLYLEGTEATVGNDVTLSLKMNNAIAATGFQCDIVLPEGMEVAKDDDFYQIDLSTERTTAQKMNYFDSALQPDGSVRVLCNSTKNYTFAGNTGEVATVTIHISSELKDGDYPLILKNIILSDASAKTYKVSYVKTTLTLSSYTLGDANNDGSIDVGDFTAIAGFIMGIPPASFIEKAADVNGDKEINVGDLTAVATLILYGSLTAPTADNRSTADMPMTVSVENSSVHAGEAFTVDVDVDGVFPFSGYQLDVLLPKGLAVKKIDDEPCAWLSTERTTQQKTDFFTCDSREDGTLRLLSASTKGHQFAGNKGSVAHITLVTDEDLQAGEYKVCIKQIVLASNTDTQTSEDTSFLVRVSSDPTDIDTMKATQEETVYDLSGRKCTGHDTLNRLNKGIYIINGHKVIK